MLYDWLTDVERQLGAAPRAVPPDCHASPRPGWLGRRDPLFKQHQHFETIFQQGVLGAGQLVMANRIAFEPGNDDPPAGVLYTFDRTLWRQPHILEGIAGRVYQFHAESESPPAHPYERTIFDLVRNGEERFFHQRLPPSLSEGFVVYLTSLMLQRTHLPGGYVTAGSFPVLVELDAREPMAIVVPSRFWPDGLLKIWD